MIRVIWYSIGYHNRSGTLLCRIFLVGREIEVKYILNNIFMICQEAGKLML